MMVDFANLICPNSPFIWDGYGISKCFNDLVLGFAVNVVTLVVIVVLGVTKRTSRSREIHISEKMFLFLLPALGACMASFNLILLLKSMPRGFPAEYHEWLLRGSEFLVWAAILLVLKCDHWLFVFSNRFLCFWWIMRTLLRTPTLWMVFSSMEALSCIKESFVLLVDVLFAILINIIRIKRRSRKNSLIEESLISCEIGIAEGFHSEPGIIHSFWRFMTFKVIDSVMEHGVKKQLDFEDLLRIPTDMDPLSCHNMLQSCWREQQGNDCTDTSLFKTICYAYGWPYFRLGLLKVLNDCVGFAGPLLLNKLIRCLQQGSPQFDGYLLAVSLGFTSLLKSFLDTQYTFHLSKLKLKLRSALTTVIYRKHLTVDADAPYIFHENLHQMKTEKFQTCSVTESQLFKENKLFDRWILKCLHVSIAEISRFSQGEIQTFMSVDVDRTVNLGNSFHDMWSLPLQIGIALYLLYTQVKFAFVSGITITVLLIPVNKWIAELIAKATKSMMEQKDERVRRTGELLSNIRTLKMYGWELHFTSLMMKTRSLEVKHLSTRKYLDAWCVFFWATTPMLFSLSTFGVYVLMGNQLDAATVFTCLALFNNLISPLNSFPWVINGLIDAIISTRRLSKFLSCFEHGRRQEQIGNLPSSSCSSEDPDSTFEDMAIVIKDACFSWSGNDQQVRDPVLDHLTLAIPKGSLVAIIGEVGSGKSSLLNSILGETKHIEGSICSSGSIAYVPQVPWILSGTIRDNVLLGKHYEPRRYSSVLEACALGPDISLMVGGDMAYTGEKGLNLSGGQRARLALARAVYHGSDIFLLDDVLSAVDAQVASWILSNAIMSPLMNKKTRVLCTHNIQAIFSADIIIVMDKGRVKWVGNPSEYSGSSYIASVKQEKDNMPCEAQSEEKGTNAPSEAPQNVVLEAEVINILEDAQDAIEIESREEGKVKTKVYMNYAAFSGWFIAIVTCISAILMQASRNGNDFWLSYWVDTIGKSEGDNRTSFYLVILCIFCLVNSLLTLVRAFSFAFGGLCAAVHVHNSLLEKLVDAPISFFDQTPGGRILNRLSSDLYTIDDSLPFILNILLANLVGLLGIAIILSLVQVMFLLLLVPFWYIYSNLQFYYRSTSRELRRLDSVARSPIYASFSEILDGSSTIRAFEYEIGTNKAMKESTSTSGLEEKDFFLAKFTKHVITYQQTSYSEMIAGLWLSLRLQFLAAFVVSFIAVMAILGSHSHLPISLGTPGLVGLSLSYAAPIVSLLGSFLTSFTETEKEMVSVERVLQYMNIPQEELHGDILLDPDWPVCGDVEFHNVTLRYMPHLPPALSGLTFTIAGGTHVGIVGRTGAGKSSILNAIFRLNPICRGQILVDRINIARTSIRDLRSRFAVVPQTPFLFEGSLRDNLDPFHVCDDSKIWKALEKCHISEEVKAVGGLDIRVKESGIFSVGQRQLLCLARTFLKSTKILCLDECTASVDTQTARKLQHAISCECRGMTVITIAHRISTVLTMDDILILDRGSLVEQGNPQVLLRDEFSRFSSLANASTM